MKIFSLQNLNPSESVVDKLNIKEPMTIILADTLTESVNILFYTTPF